MKKRITGFTLSAVIIALFYFFQISPRIENSSIPLFPKKTEAQQGLKLLKLPKASPPLHPEVPPIVSITTPLSEDNKEVSCWEKISPELSNQDFTATNSLGRLVGDWYFSKNPETPIENASTAEGKFILALARAGLLEGKKVQIDEDEALKLLSEVSELDPKNSAPFLYAAIIEDRRGNHKRSDEFFSQAQNSEMFDSYITTISKTIFSQVQTSSDLVQAYGMWSTLAIPDYLSLKKFLKKHHGKKFVHQLLKNGLDPESIINDIEWFPLEYAVGKSLLDSMEPENKLPPYREMLKQKNDQSLVNADKLYSELQSTCDVSVLYPMVDLMRKRLSHYQ